MIWDCSPSRYVRVCVQVFQPCFHLVKVSFLSSLFTISQQPSICAWLAFFCHDTKAIVTEKLLLLLCISKYWYLLIQLGSLSCFELAIGFGVTYSFSLPFGTWMLALDSVTALVLSGLSSVGGQITRTGSMSMCVREERCTIGAIRGSGQHWTESKEALRALLHG